MSIARRASEGPRKACSRLCNLVILVVCAGVSVRSAQAQSCPSDVTGNRIVNGEDLATVLAQWGTCSSPSACAGDTNSDGQVNGVDLANVLASWGYCPVTVPGWATLLESYPDPAVVHDPARRESIIASGYAWRVVDTATQIEMVLVPPGTFMMGCSPSLQYGCYPWEGPIHQVTLTQPLYMGRYEVTQDQWRTRMGSNPAYFRSASAEVPASEVPSRPVEFVSWNMIQGFLSATGLRLPTEAEWEYAYRAGTTTSFHSMPGYPNGTNDDSLAGNIAWFLDNSYPQTRPVGGRAANGFGLHDMAGNVWEWVNDWWGEYPRNAETDPIGPFSGAGRVIRGGSWNYGARFARSSNRSFNSPSDRTFFIGFRVARNP